MSRKKYSAREHGADLALAMAETQREYLDNKYAYYLAIIGFFESKSIYKKKEYEILFLRGLARLDYQSLFTVRSHINKKSKKLGITEREAAYVIVYGKINEAK